MSGESRPTWAVELTNNLSDLKAAGTNAASGSGWQKLKGRILELLDGPECVSIISHVEYILQQKNHLDECSRTEHMHRNGPLVI